MELKKLIGNRWVTILFVVGGWSLSALFAASFIILQDYSAQRFNPLGLILIWQFATSLEWIILTPLIFLVINKFPLGEGKNWRNITAHLIAGLGIILLRQAMDAYVQPKLGFPPGRQFTSYFESLRFIFIIDFHYSVFNYCVALGLIFGVRYYRQFRERELKAAQLEARLSQARMHVLKMQLHPHFLFNTHNAISELIYKDPEAAERMLTNLSDLLRISLNNLEVEKITLKQELDFLNKYLEIEQTRFQDRLRVKYDIEPRTYGAIVPNMILQPLVENAIKHGITPLASGGTITISAMSEAQKLYLEVSDDGIGVPFGNPAEIMEGIGLSNTQARLKHLYGAAHAFNIRPNGKSGLRLKLMIPYTETVKPKNGIRNGVGKYENSHFSC
jgi:signal transduction histidine kinase